MPERSFGRTVRYRRTRLGLSQAKLGELVGRSTGTIRSWERDLTQPNDPKILEALAAILAVDERQLFEKAGVERPEVETSPTVEQALATLTTDQVRAIDEVTDKTLSDVTSDVSRASRPPLPNVPPSPNRSVPGFVTPPEPYPITSPTPSLADVSYVEDRSQRQLYRLRNMATLVVSVALVVALLWAISESLGALGAWWDEFFGNLRL